MKKILVINGSASPLKCGVGYYGEALVAALAHSAHVEVLTTEGLGQTIPGASQVHHIANWKISRLGAITSLIKSAKPDIVHIQYPAVGYKRELGINLLPLWLRLSSRKLPVIVTLHEYYGSVLLGKIRDLITVFAAHKVIVSNEYDRDALPRLIRRKTVIVPIGHNFKRAPKNRAAYESFMQQAGLSPNEPTIAYFGFVNASKGVDVLVQAASQIKAQVLILADLNPSDPYQQKIRSLVEAANQQGAHIYVAGFLENTILSQVLQECLLFVLAQPLPLTAKTSTAISAVEHGLVLVSTAARQPRYNFPYINDKNAALLSRATESEIARVCNELLVNPQKANQLRNNPELLNYFAWETIAQKHIELYDAIATS